MKEDETKTTGRAKLTTLVDDGGDTANNGSNLSPFLDLFRHFWGFGPAETAMNSPTRTPRWYS